MSRYVLVGEKIGLTPARTGRCDMGVIMCARCDAVIDLDYNVEETIVVGDEEMCWTCATDEE